MFETSTLRVELDTNNHDSRPNWRASLWACSVPKSREKESYMLLAVILGGEELQVGCLSAGAFLMVLTAVLIGLRYRAGRGDVCGVTTTKRSCPP